MCVGEMSPPTHRHTEGGNRHMPHRGMRVEPVNSRVTQCRIRHDTCCMRKMGVRDCVMEVSGALHHVRVRLTL